MTLPLLRKHRITVRNLQGNPPSSSRNRTGFRQHGIWLLSGLITLILWMPPVAENVRGQSVANDTDGATNAGGPSTYYPPVHIPPRMPDPDPDSFRSVNGKFNSTQTVTPGNDQNDAGRSMSFSDSGIQNRLPPRQRQRIEPPPQRSATIFDSNFRHTRQLPKKKIVKSIFSQPPALEPQYPNRRSGLQNKIAEAFNSLGARENLSNAPVPSNQPHRTSLQPDRTAVAPSNRQASYDEDLRKQVDEARAELQRRQNARLQQVPDFDSDDAPPYQDSEFDRRSARSPFSEPAFTDSAPFSEMNRPGQVDQQSEVLRTSGRQQNQAFDEFNYGRLPSTRPVSVLNKAGKNSDGFLSGPSEFQENESANEFSEVENQSIQPGNADAMQPSQQASELDDPPVKENVLRSIPRNGSQRSAIIFDPMQDDFSGGDANEQEDLLQQDLRVDQEDSRLQRKSCEDFREQLLNNPISDIALDISPPGPSTLADGTKLTRTWTSRYGMILAEGSMIDLRRGYVIIEHEDGTVKIPYARLSDADLAAISEYWRIPVECGIGDGKYTVRSWVPQTFTWTASSLCHKPLYFENIQLERYGHSSGPFLQPIDSTFHFFTRLFFLPYNRAIHPPNECQYALGYYRPGNCAPWLKSPVPISLNGATRQTLFWTGFAAVTGGN